MLNVQRLRVLKEVAAHRSFSAAAEALAYTQSAVSQAVATLEAETGATLIERDRKGVRPTAAGEALLSHADAIFARIEAAEDALASIMGVRGGRLRMASFPTAGNTLMPLAIARFRGAHPDVELTLAEGEPEDMAPRLRTGEFDLALLFEFQGAGASKVTSGLRSMELREDPLHVVLPKGHELAERDAVRLEDLSREAWIQTSAESPCARHIVRSCLEVGFNPTVSFESDDYQTVLGLIATGVGVALIPELALAGARDDVEVRELAGKGVTRRVIAATPRSAGVPPAVTPMLELLKEVAGQFPAWAERAGAA
jgi:DNA-binding transcriptional LysR family regulator